MNEVTNLVGIENIKALLGVAAKLGNVVGKAAVDGFNKSDVVFAPDLFFALAPMFTLEYSQIVPEAKDLTADESAELVAYFREVFDIPQDAAEVVIEDVLSLVNETVSLVMKFVKIFKK